MPDIPETPVTREEQYLAAIAGEPVDVLDTPNSREERYLAAIAGENVDVPDPPASRKERYLAQIYENGGTGEGGDITTQVLRARENGTYRAEAGKAYNPVYVQVPEPETYAGAYEVESAPFEDVTLSTSGKLMSQDVTVKKIPVAEVSNTKGGYTITIGR